MGMHTYRQLITKESESTLTTLEPNSDVEAMDAKHDKDRKRFFIETHGCQMNLADSDVVRAVLLSVNYEICDVLEDADLILINTCAIRENAEAKIWQRLRYFRSLKRKRKALLREMKKKGMIDVSDDSEKKAGGPDGPTVGVLGCMAERLKDRMLEEEEVDFIAGPDAYRDLPSLLKIVSTDSKAANVQLSLEETYSDIQPVRLAEGNVHAFVSIQRGCDNHCAFCVVPFTRGRERSRPVQSIVEEVRALSKQGIREVVLLGQNVNSYRDRSAESTLDADIEGVLDTNAGAVDERNLAEGFSERPRPRRRKQETSTMTDEIEDDDDRPAASAITFAQLLEAVAEVDPEMRIRFQSPHPKDFTDDLLHVIARLPNVCRSLHMPAQHGSTTALERMKRGYVI
jgi:tRNA A37 methylthiotransferase MiaB